MDESSADGSAGAGAAAAPVLFLDVDGVLVPHPDGGGWREALDPACVRRVSRIVAATGVRVVLSSLWRHSRSKRQLIEASGIPIFGVTPIVAGGPRGSEITLWLRQAQARGVAVLDYAILDDSEDAAIAGHFTLVDPRLGVTDAIADAVIARFGGKEAATEEAG